MRRAKRLLGCLERRKRARREKGKDGRAQAGDIALRNQDRLVQNVGVDLVERFVLLRDAAAIDDAPHGGAVLFHASQDDASVEGGALDRGEELVLRRMGEMPAERDAAQFGIHQNGSVAVIPAETQKAGLAGAIAVQARCQLRSGFAAAASDRFEDIADGRETRFDARVILGSTEPGTTPQTPGIKLRPVAEADDTCGRADDIHDIAQTDACAHCIPVRVECADRNRNAGLHA